MADTAETFQGFGPLRERAELILQQAIKTGTVAKKSFTDANGATHEYRDAFELLRAVDLLKAREQADSAPSATARRMISLVSPR